MGNRRNTLRILLDTAFILPTLGIDVGKEVETCLRHLSRAKAELYYSRFSIMEALWVAAKLMRSQSFDIERFSQGLRSIMRGGRYRKVEEDHQIFEEALDLYMMGHRDMIDNLLYATSANLDLKLLTLDAELREFIRNKGLRETLISPDQLKKVT